MRTMTPFNSSFQQMRAPVLRNTDAHTHVSLDGHGDKDDFPSAQAQHLSFRLRHLEGLVASWGLLCVIFTSILF